MALWKKLLLIGFSVGAGLVVSLAAIGGAFYWYEQRPGPTRDWPDTKIESLNLKASLKTKWRNGTIQFQFAVFPGSDGGKAAFHSAVFSSASKNSVVIHFYDSSGFRVCEVPVREEDFTHRIGPAGAVAALDANSSGNCNRGDYEAADKWNFVWEWLPDATPKRGDTGKHDADEGLKVIPSMGGVRPQERWKHLSPDRQRLVNQWILLEREGKLPESDQRKLDKLREVGLAPMRVEEPKLPVEIRPPKPPNVPEKWRIKTLWRQLEKGMTKQQVRELLGEPARVEGGLLEYWYYGTGGVLGAHVAFSGDRVYSWSEP